MKFNLKLKIGGLVTISDKDYVVTSCEVTRRVHRRSASETATLSLLPTGEGDDGDVTEVVFHIDTEGGKYES